MRVATSLLRLLLYRRAFSAVRWRFSEFCLASTTKAAAATLRCGAAAAIRKAVRATVEKQRLGGAGRRCDKQKTSEHAADASQAMQGARRKPAASKGATRRQQRLRLGSVCFRVLGMLDLAVQVQQGAACPVRRWATHGQLHSHDSPATSRCPPIALFCVCSWRGCTDRLEKAAQREAMAAAVCGRLSALPRCSKRMLKGNVAAREAG